MTTLLKKTLVLFCMLLFFGVSNDTFAQHLLKINEDIGGGGSSAQVSQSDDSMMYIVGGAIIIGIIVYAVLRDKKEKTVEEDSTSAFNNTGDFLRTLSLNQQNKNNDYNLPLEFFMGLQRINSFSEERNYVIGLRLNL